MNQTKVIPITAARRPHRQHNRQHRVQQKPTAAAQLSARAGGLARAMGPGAVDLDLAVAAPGVAGPALLPAQAAARARVAVPVVMVPAVTEMVLAAMTALVAVQVEAPGPAAMDLAGVSPAADQAIAARPVFPVGRREMDRLPGETAEEMAVPAAAILRSSARELVSSAIRM